MSLFTRHTRRLLAAYREDGAAALTHGNRGRRPANATPDSVIAEVVYLAIRDFYQRLLAASKPKKVSLTACMRKLLVILNSMLKHRSTWCDLTLKVSSQSS